MRAASPATRLAARHIPENARCILEHTNGSALYVYEYTFPTGQTKPYALAFWGTSAKPLFHFFYDSEEKRQQKIMEFKSAVEAHVARKTAASAERSAWVNPLKVGDILYTSWGYDQTNVEFFAVTKVSGKRVWVREIASDYEATGYMSGKTWPAMPIRFTGEETMHVAQPSGKSVYIKISECRHAWPETGREHGTTSYA